MERKPRHVHIIHAVVRLFGGFIIGFGVIIGLVEAGIISSIVPYIWPAFMFGLGIWCIVHPG